MAEFFERVLAYTRAQEGLTGKKLQKATYKSVRTVLKTFRDNRYIPVISGSFALWLANLVELTKNYISAPLFVVNFFYLGIYDARKSLENSSDSLDNIGMLVAR